jgi:hypothetical protein
LQWLVVDESCYSNAGGLVHGAYLPWQGVAGVRKF